MLSCELLNCKSSFIGDFGLQCKIALLEIKVNDNEKFLIKIVLYCQRYVYDGV